MLKWSGALLGLMLQCAGAEPARAAGSLPVCRVVNGQVAVYDIVRGGRVIGQHILHFTLSGTDLTVEVDVAVTLRALGVTVYRYQHHAQERWRAGVMVSMVSRTDDDGTVQQVNASLNLADGTWRGTGGAPPGAGPLMATSLWNSTTLSQTRLLDHETGQIVPVHASPLRPDTVTLGERQVPAFRSDLVGGTAGSVWYDENGCWVRAMFNSPVDGSLLEVRAKLPPPRTGASSG